MTTSASHVLQMQFDRLTQEFKNTLGKLGARRLSWRPEPRANDIGSMLWHSARAWDGYLFYIDGAAESFLTQAWATRFGIETKPRNAWDDGYDKHQVECVRAHRKLFIEYVNALYERTSNFLVTATSKQLATSVKIPWWPDEKPEAYVLAHILRHSYQHLGEAQYVKGMMMRKANRQRARQSKK